MSDSQQDDFSRSAVYKSGYQQAQLDILRHLFKGNNLYFSDDKMRIARAVLGFTTSTVLDDPVPLGIPETNVISKDDDIPF